MHPARRCRRSDAAPCRSPRSPKRSSAGWAAASRPGRRSCRSSHPPGSNRQWSPSRSPRPSVTSHPVSYTHLRAHETGRNIVCRLLLEKKKKKQRKKKRKERGGRKEERKKRKRRKK